MTRETGERPLRIVSGTIIHHAPLHGAGKEHELEHLKKHNAVSEEELKAARCRFNRLKIRHCRDGFLAKFGT